MPVTSDKSAPYAPPRAILEIIERHRERGIPDPLNAEVLGRAGISDSLLSRTLQALQTLDLINEDGSHTKVLEGLRLAPEAEFKDRLAEWLNAAYADVLEYVNPATDDETQIRDAFRPYKPTGQQPRMVTLFTGLYSAAGISTRKTVTKQENARTGTGVSKRRKPSKQMPSGERVSCGIPAPLEGLLSSLPREGGGWTQAQRNKFLTTFGAVVDFCFEIVEPSENVMNDENEDKLLPDYVLSSADFRSR